MAPVGGPSAAEEQDFLVYFDRTLCLSLAPALATVACVKQQLQARAGVPLASLELYVNGRRLAADDARVPPAPVMVRARQTGALLGGKGGFGAMLRSMGKGSGAKATTDFGACRDLHGRRLRHVNQEIAMHKWREERTQREQQQRDGVTEREVLDEDTPSGIPGWYLATPSWAEGIKKSYMKRRRNTVMCSNWLQARADGRQAPPNAPRWWGCPRGRDCDFAHGEDELRGAGLTEFKRAKKREAQQQQQQELQAYVNYERDVPDDLADAIQQGMRRRKQLQRKSKAKAVTEEHKPLPATQPDATTTASPMSPAISDWLVPFDSGSKEGDKAVEVTFRHGLCELRGRSNFGTATASPSVRLVSDKWYYEVRLVTDGVVQLGWADTIAFTANSATGDGVGDHARSWSFDGRRQLKWTDGKEEEYGELWHKNDVIGCLLDADSGVVAFSLNGESLGDAFDSDVKPSNGKPSAFVPAISVEQAEILLVNIGAQPLLYLPEGYRPVSEAVAATEAKSNSQTDVSSSEDTKQPVLVAAEEPSKVVTNSKAEKARTTPREKKVEKEYPPIDLDAVTTVDALTAHGMDALKAELRRRGLKCGYEQDVCNICCCDRFD
jgi:hypothetical protein